MIAQARQHVDGEATDATGRTGNDHRAVSRCQAVVFHAHDSKRRGKPRSAQRHGLEQIQPLRQGYNPLRRHARILGITAVMGNANVVAGGNDLVAGLEAGISTFDHFTGQVDAAHTGKTPDDPAYASSRQRVLVVDARIMHANRDFAGVKLLGGQRRHAGKHFSVRILIDYKGLERIHTSALLAVEYHGTFVQN